MKQHQANIDIKKPVIDGLTYVLPWDTSAEDYATQLLHFKTQLKLAQESGRCIPAYVGMDRYKHNLRIPLSDGKSAFVQAGGLNARNGIRVHLNPRTMIKADVTRVNECLAYLVGPSFNSMIQRPRLNRIDVAVDIYGIELDDLLVSYKFNQRTTIVQKVLGRNARTESIYFGSIASDYKSLAYDKVQDEVEGRLARLLHLVKAGEPATESLRLNVIQQIKQLKSDFKVVRLEVRGTKLGGIPIGQVDALENRFARFKIADLHADGDELPKRLKDIFLTLCQQKGVKGALKALPVDLRKKVETYCQVRDAPWWKPEPMWGQACQALRDANLFPLAAFDLPFSKR